ncbi:MAG: SLOG family protein [Alistipes sp.]|nr:SLOG family protein [Alistipes sp.]
MNGLYGNAPADGIGGTTAASYQSVIREKLHLAIGQLVEEGFDTFICGMATGFDLMAGEVVCDFIERGAAVTLVAAIPFPAQADRFAPADRLLYERVLSYAAHTHTLCPSYRKECYHMRNDFLVAGASVLLCFYNGSPGGTRYTVRKALRAGLRIVNLF